MNAKARISETRTNSYTVSVRLPGLSAARLTKRDGTTEYGSLSTATTAVKTWARDNGITLQYSVARLTCPR